MTHLYKEKNGIKGLIPLIVFVVLYVFIGIYLTISGEQQAFYQFPAPTSALMAFGVALMLGGRSVNKHILSFTSGIKDETVILMCLIFMLAGAFAAVSSAIGSVQSTVNLGLYLIPAKIILPGIFILSCFLSLAMGTSMGTISALAPIAAGIALKSGIDLSITMSAVLGGAIFGDNLSIISDTTIAATSSQGCNMRDKMLANIKIAMPAAVITIILLYFFTTPTVITKIDDFDLIKTLPYITVLVLAFLGVNVIAVLMIGIGLSAIIGLSSGDISFIEFGQATYSGFLNMAEVFFLSVLVAGLAGLANEQGGVSYLINKIKKRIKSKRSAQLGLASFISLADICLANNTIAILVSGKAAKSIANEYKISPARSASILDIFSCVWQGILPYGAQLLLISALADLSPFDILPFAWYQYLLALFALAAIYFGFPREQQ